MRLRLFALFILPFGTSLGQNPTVTVNVDAGANRRAINPNIYGVAHADAATLSDLNVPLNRYGGNNTSRYNWQINADNRGQDWYFESIPESSAVAGARGDTFISTSRSGGAEPMITIPMVDWIAKLGSNRSKLASFSQAKYGAQTANDWQWFPDAGNGILKSTGKEVAGNDPNDANVPNNSAFQGQWVDSLIARWGRASAGGLKYYILDNEHSIWHSTHRDVHPTGVTMDQVKTKILDYANAIKLRDSSALVVGPEEWGWSGYLFSGYDQQYGSKNGWGYLPDRVAHGGMDYLPWLLQQLKASNVAGGSRPLDIFTVHYYPQGGEFSDDVSSTMQLRRNRSTRSLWDPAYTDETWIADKVMLIPRLRNWTDTYYYPGTPIGLTEYNWGAESHINGATAQADILGIFGREGLDMGARWTTPATSTPTYKAIKMYRNYDGAKSSFGDVSVNSVVPNPDNVAAFGAERTADGALTVMVINKYLTGSTPVTLNLANFPAGAAAQVYQLTSSNVISRLADVPVTAYTLNATVPQQSVTLFVLPRANGNQTPVARITATPVSGNAPLTVNFSGTQSSDADGTITSYAWTFGNGASSAGVTTSYTYTAPGAYTASLTVTDEKGAANTANVVITVSDPNALNAPGGLTASTRKGQPVTLRWTDNSTNETGFEIWRAPSGSTAFALVATTGANAVTYGDTAPRGNYQYKVRAKNAAAASAFSNTVSVSVK